MNVYFLLGNPNTYAGDLQPPLYSHLQFPMHIIGIVGMGIHVIDNADFELLSQKCDSYNQYTFALQFAPIQFEGCTGSPINPIAMF